MKTYTLGKLDSARRYGTDTLSSALDTQYGKVVLGAANNLLDTTDKYVDYYLPEDAAPAAAGGFSFLRFRTSVKLAAPKGVLRRSISVQIER